MSIAENMITAALSAAAGGGAIGLWFQSKMKKIVTRKIDDIVVDIADLVKLELPEIDEIKKNVGILIDSGVREVNNTVNRGLDTVRQAANSKPKKNPLAFDKTAGVGRGKGG